MADLSGVTTNFLATASETFEDNLSASITAGATIVPVNNASEYVNGDIAVITVDAGTNDEATFVGRKNGNQFEDCIWTEGNIAADHASGAPVVDYDSATHYNLVTKALKGIMEQDGSLKADPIRDALNLSTASTAGWEVFPNVLQVSSGYSQGAKIYNLTVPNADATSIASQGMALRYERATTPPTNSLDLESSSSQYATKATPANISFTDDYTLEAIFTLESYTGAEQIIVGRRNGTTEGWSLSVNANGQLVATAQRIAANNRVLTSARILPLGEPIHVAVTQDHSANVHAMYINGESVSFTNTTTGTITAIVQGTSDLRVGALSSSASLYFDGRLQEVRVWNTIRTSTQINDNMGQMLTGSETNLVAYYPFSTNLNDLTANANHLTGSGGAAVSAGNVFKATGYARIVSATYSAPNTIIQVYAGDDFIPNMTLNSLFFSTSEAPYGLPQTLQVTSYNLGKRSVKGLNIDFESFTGTTTQWRSWTPSFTNFTGTIDVARYTLIGKFCFFYLKVTQGASVTGQHVFSLPVQAADAQAVLNPINTLNTTGYILDNGTAQFPAQGQLLSATTMGLLALNAAGTYLSPIATSATAPMTWASGQDSFYLSGWYEVL